jgi:hypothetical protein
MRALAASRRKAPVCHVLTTFALAAALAACDGAPATGEGGGNSAASIPSITPIEFPGGAGSGQPHLAATVDGMPVVSWLEPAADGMQLRFARFATGSWSTPVDVVSGEDLFVNWADFPSVVPISAELWFAHWLKLKPDAFGAYDVATALSQDGGRTWSAAVKLNDDETATEHGFVTAFPWEGAIGTIYLDSRELANWSFDEPDALLGVSLRAVRLAADGRVAGREIIDGLVCDCCQPDVAVTADGAPVIVYRDRSEDEIRDVVARRYTDGHWSEPVQLGAEGWFIEGCPVNGPAVAAAGQTVAAAWFTAADGRGRVRFARSVDGGAHFGAALDIDALGAYGQADIVLGGDGTAVVSWWRRAAAGGIDLVLRTVSPDGRLGEIVIVGHNDEPQPIDVPQMIRAGDALLIAWTSFADDGRILTATVRGVL